MNQFIQLLTALGNKSLPLVRLLPAEFSTFATCQALTFLSNFVNDYSGLDQYIVSGKAVEPLEFRGINFPTRVGIAAGLDKNGEYINGLGLLGPGFIEIGSVLSTPWRGNDKPRLWRLPSASGLVNSMGLPSVGMDQVTLNLQRNRWNGVLGINLAKHPKQSEASFIEILPFMMEKFSEQCDYFTINLSCPNTDDLLAIQDRNYQNNLFAAIAEFNAQQKTPKPIFIKVAPLVSEIKADLYFWPEKQLIHLQNMMYEFDISGVIITNSIPDSRLYQHLPEYTEAIKGGVSGGPVSTISESLLEQFRLVVPAERLVISCGGILTQQDVQRRLEKGADLVQVYTGLIYSGNKLFHSYA